MEIENNNLISLNVADFIDSKLIIPNNVVRITSKVLENVAKRDNIVSVWLPQSLKYIDSFAFSGCHELKNIYFYSDKQDIEDFSDGKISKSELNKNNHLVEIGKSAFSYTNIDEFFVPNTMTKLGNMCFLNSNLKKIDFDENSSLQVINSSVFAFCKKLKKVVIPESVKSFEIISVDNIKNVQLIEFLGYPDIKKMNSSEEQEITETKLKFAGSSDFGDINLCEVVKFEKLLNIRALMLCKRDKYNVFVSENGNVTEYKPNEDMFSFNKFTMNDAMKLNSIPKIKVFEDIATQLNFKGRFNIVMLGAFKNREDIKRFVTGHKLNKIYRNVEKKVNAFYELSNLSYSAGYVRGLVSFAFMLGAFSDNEKLRQQSADFIYNEILKTKDVYSVYNFLEFDGVDLFNNENESYYQFWKDNYKKLINVQNEETISKVEDKVKFYNYLNNNFDRLKQLCKNAKQPLNVKNIISIYNNETFVCDDVKKKDIYEQLKKYPNRTQEQIDFVYDIKREIEKNKITQNIFEKFDEKQQEFLYDESKLKDNYGAKLNNGYSFEWINKYRTYNLTYAKDDRTGCANIFDRGAGIAVCGMKLDNCQNLRIIAPNGKGIARATVILDKENGSLLYNTFMVYGHTKMTTKEKQDIYDCFEYATIDFIERYKKNFPKNKKINLVNVGIGCNGLITIFNKQRMDNIEELKGINFSLYGNSSQANVLWNGDWEDGQYCFLTPALIRQASQRYKKCVLKERIDEIEK